MSLERCIYLSLSKKHFPLYQSSIFYKKLKYAGRNDQKKFVVLLKIAVKAILTDNYKFSEMGIDAIMENGENIVFSFFCPGDQLSFYLQCHKNILCNFFSSACKMYHFKSNCIKRSLVIIKEFPKDIFIVLSNLLQQCGNIICQSSLHVSFRSTVVITVTYF
jgi:hypothetical protein